MEKIQTESKFYSSTTDESSKNWDNIHNLPPPPSLLKKIILMPNSYILKNQTITLLFVLHNSCLFQFILFCDRISVFELLLVGPKKKNLVCLG